MRVAHICTKFNRISETFIYDLIGGLERAGLENHVLTAARVNVMERPFSRVRVLPIPPWQQAGFAIRKHWLNTYHFPLPPRATRAALRDVKADVILAHFGGAGAAVAPVADKLGIPLVVVFHAFDLFMRQFRPATYKALWETGAQAVVVSEYGKRRLRELGCPEERVCVIHCGVDIARFAGEGDRQPGANGLRLVTIGRFVEKKGFDDLLRAMAAIRGRIPHPVCLDIWGDGPLKHRLESLARWLGLRNAVSFKGVAASQDVPQLLRRYDAFVLPSKRAHNGDSEGIPITILEAQAAGLPIVATRHAGIPEAIPDANHSLLARERDVEDLAAKLVLLSSQRTRWREIGLCGKAWVTEHFSLSAEVAAYRALLQETATRCRDRHAMPKPCARSSPASTAPDTRRRYETEKTLAARILAASPEARDSVAATAYAEYNSAFPHPPARADGRMGATRHKERFLNALLPPTGRVLEIGCGYGQTAAALTTGTRELVGLDVSKVAIEEARQRFPHLQFVHGNGVTADLGAGAFDAVCSVDLIEHLHPDDAEAHLTSVSGGA